MDQDGKYYRTDRLFLLTGEQLNVTIWAIKLLIEDFPPGSESRSVLSTVLAALERKESYEKLLDRMGASLQAPTEDEVKKNSENDSDITWKTYLASFGLKPPEVDERN